MEKIFTKQIKRKLNIFVEMKTEQWPIFSQWCSPLKPKILYLDMFETWCCSEGIMTHSHHPVMYAANTAWVCKVHLAKTNKETVWNVKRFNSPSTVAESSVLVPPLMKDEWYQLVKVNWETQREREHSGECSVNHTASPLVSNFRLEVCLDTAKRCC